MITLLIEHCALYLPFILGAYFSFNILNRADLSIEAAYLAGALVAAHLLAITTSSPLLYGLVAILACIGGSLIGLCSGLIEHFCRITPVLASIITLGIFHGIAFAVLGGAHQTVGNMELSHSLLIITAVGILILASVILYTQLGYSLTIYGINPRFFAHHRINSLYISLAGLALSNGLAGLSGFLIAQAHSFVDIGMGHGLALMGLCSLMIGTLITPKMNVRIPVIPLVGTLAYFLMQQTLLRLGCTSAYFTIIQSLIICGGLLSMQYVRKIS